MHFSKKLEKKFTMFSLLRSRVLCAVPMEAPAFTRLNGAEFVGRVGTNTDPRKLAPVITSNVINGNKAITISCISRNAASKAMHAVAIANTKNPDASLVCYCRPMISDSKEEADLELAKRGLTCFKLAMIPDVRPKRSVDSVRFTHRMKVAASVDHNELARNIHTSYMQGKPLILECMGDRAMSVVTHAIALFNQRVQSHDMVSYTQIITGRSPEGTELAKMEFQLFERPKNVVY